MRWDIAYLEMAEERCGPNRLAFPAAILTTPFNHQREATSLVHHKDPPMYHHVKKLIGIIEQHQPGIQWLHGPWPAMESIRDDCIQRDSVDELHDNIIITILLKEIVYFWYRYFSFKVLLELILPM